MLNSIKMKLKRGSTGTSPSAGTASSSSTGVSPAAAAASTTTTTTTSTTGTASISTAAASGDGFHHLGNGATPASPSAAATAAALALDSSVPRADIGLPHHAVKRERRRSSVTTTAALLGSSSGSNTGNNNNSTTTSSSINNTGSGNNSSASTTSTAASLHAATIAAVMVDLPSLRDAPLAKREALFKQKLQQCTVVEFDWDDPDADRRAKECKRAALVELVDYINTPGGQKILTEAAYQDVMNMVSINIFRALPASGPFGPNGEELLGGGGPGSGGAGGASGGGGEGGGGGEDDEPYLEPAWVHLQLVYELLLRFVVSGEVKVKSAKKQIDTAFCAKIIELFNSEDPRERDYLKTILHRIYGKFLIHRSYIRKAIAYVFFRFVYETEKHNGIGELLEILGSIINGFALPLKEEHVQFLEKALVPLHRPQFITGYFQQLSFCMVQYIEKDPTTVCNILSGIIKCWPWSSSSKQILLLNEAEELLEVAGAEASVKVLPTLFKLLGRCVGSPHFQVAERALFLWNNESLTAPSGVLSRTFVNEATPALADPLRKKASGHWNTTVESLANTVMRHYRDANPGLWDAVIAKEDEKLDTDAAFALEKQKKWELVEAAAKKAYPNGLPTTTSSNNNNQKKNTNSNSNSNSNSSAVVQRPESATNQLGSGAGATAVVGAGSG